MKTLIALAVLALAACGGGDPEPETASAEPPNCAASSNPCK